MKKIHSFDEIFDSQKVFRLILTAMSNPTRVVNIKEYSNKLFGNNKEFLVIAMTLLDNEVSFNTCENRELSDLIISLTLSKREKIEQADYIFITDNQIENVINNAKSGNLIDPQKSATIIIKIDDKKDTEVSLIGAGINGVSKMMTSSVVKKAIEIRNNQFFEYPCGIDFIFVCDNGDLFSIPRLTILEVL